MVRRILVFATVATLGLSLSGARADAPIPEAGVLGPEAAKVVSGPCVAESAFDVAYDANQPGLNEKQLAALHDGPAYEQCSRLKVVFGPIMAKPGQNDVLIQPVTYEKPQYDGYMVRFKPDLVNVTGDAPRVKDLHLHHGTWLNPGYFGSDAEYFDTPLGQVPNPGRTYGQGPFLASGEEKTVVIWPKNTGLKVKQSDAWIFLHMIHNATAETFPVWVTYDIDFIPAAAAEADTNNDGVNDIVKTKGIWLDVGDCSFDNGWADQAQPQERCTKDQFNPIFNAQRGFGEVAVDEFDGRSVCVFPRENCAMINTLAEVSGQQGADVSGKYADPVVDEVTIREDGTLVMMGGHLHNGGIRDDVYLVRDLNEDGVIDEETEVKLIHKSDAYYFDHGIDWDNDWQEGVSDFDPLASRIGAPEVSWDFVMTGVTSDVGWNVNVKKGDRLRLEGIYDTQIASWYEQMGIVMTWMVPHTESNGKFGVDVFDDPVTIHEGINTQAVQPGVIPGESIPGSDAGPCTNSESTLCVRGQMTHSRIPSSGDHWSCTNGCPNRSAEAADGPLMTDIAMGGFGYGLADHGVIGFNGVPTVKVNQPVTWWNLDTPAYMWHTVTRCASPCSGTTSASYPIADGAWQDVAGSPVDVTVKDWQGNEHVVPAGSTVEEILDQVGPDPMDFDSGQIGVGTGANNKVDWVWTPTRTGTFDFYCRIHPGMRGAVRVVA